MKVPSKEIHSKSMICDFLLIFDNSNHGRNTPDVAYRPRGRKSPISSTIL